MPAEIRMAGTAGPTGVAAMRLTIAVAVLALLGRPAFAEEAHASAHASAAAPRCFVKDGDSYRPATDDEVKAAAPASTGHGEKGGLDFTGF